MNCAGCYNKIQSLVDNVKHIGAGIFTLQETHFKRKGRINDKFSDFEIFESIRKKQKGGTLIGAHKSLDPILIEEYSEDFELLVIEVKVGGKEIRIISGYGPQANWPKEERTPFFNALEEEVIKAKSSQKAVLIQMDANSKLGPNIVKGDPHAQSNNGKILAGILERNDLIVINSLEKCKGKITRQRLTKNKKEESIIDFVIVCEEMEEVIEEMIIDENKEFALASYRKTKTGAKIKLSDHNSLVTKIKAEWKKEEPKLRIEIYNFKDKDGIEKFRKITSKDTFLSSIFKEEGSIEAQTKIFLKRLKFCISQSFKKIRIKGSKRNKKLDDLFNKRRILKNRKDETSVQMLKNVEDKLADICAEDNLKIIVEACEGLTCEEGGVNVAKLWKLKKQLRGIWQEPPTAMLDSSGNLVTTSKALETLSLQMYKERLTGHEIKEGLNLHKVQREKLFEQRLREAQDKKTPDWTEDDLNNALKQLKNNKSRDPLGYSNELFKPENAGQDLKLAVLKMSNKIKKNQKFPESLNHCNISSLYKNKGSRKIFNNYRGIFRVTVIRSIIDKLIYNDEYLTIDENLTDSNVGARKN